MRVDPGNAAGNHDRRAELADARARSPARRRRASAGNASGRRDREEHARAATRRASPRRLVAPIDLLEAGAHGAHEERQPHDGHREHDRLPREDHFDAQPRRGRPRSDRAAQKSRSRMRPVATGGMTSGSDTNVSTRTRPRKRRRASSQASTSPGGSISAVAPAAVSHGEPRDLPDVHQTVSAYSTLRAGSFHRGGRRARGAICRVLCALRGLGGESSRIGTTNLAARRSLLRLARAGRRGTAWPRLVARRREDRAGIHDARPVQRPDHERQNTPCAPRRDRSVDDRGVDAPGLDGGERGPDVARRHDARLEAVPQPSLLEIPPRVHARRHSRRIADRDAPKRRPGRAQTPGARSRRARGRHDRQLIREQIDPRAGERRHRPLRRRPSALRRR